MFTGWDDNHDNGDGTKGAFCLENQWSTSWGYVINGKGGRAWCKYGADAAGTEAIWIDGGTPPQPTPGPLPPWLLQPGQESAIIKPQERSIINITVNLNFPKCGCK
jgi:hypothetical protein